ncbi:glycoprotein 3-alpha-L-fucosyltransferase [Profundibacterium mesophilum KAUST100406-0324]|uniref:Glycoprotein 3-alpha-L-fucosyltransferase n=2 Tax=Profundibacterium TaxID=1258570 RepID=A0A921TEX9_9RHOB|nr:glycoprotein 3-alpha-L-fucosyltransferase [Profundibacterium mesophilum KAUST100406-0324]
MRDAKHVDDTGAGRETAIVIASYNRPEELRTCLEALAGLDGGPVRTIVVDDGSDTPLAGVCAPFDWAECIRQPNAGPGQARNRGVRAAEGAELICFTDDDCRPRPDWLTRLVAAQGGIEKRLVGGRIENALPRNVYSSASQSLSSYLYDFYQSHGSGMTFFTTNNVCFRREDFLAVGGFGDFAVASEDRDLSLRWSAAGGTLVYAPDAVVDHAHALDMGTFWRQHAGYGRGLRDLHKAMNARADGRSKLEGAGFYLNMLGYPLRKEGHNRLGQSLLIGLSQVAMIAGYGAALRRERRARAK